mgnify:FL=1
MTITKTMIEERIIVLNTDIDKINTKLRDLEQQRIENIALLNALTGAKQQCDSFLNEFNNEKEPSGSESDVG